MEQDLTVGTGAAEALVQQAGTLPAAEPDDGAQDSVSAADILAKPAGKAAGGGADKGGRAGTRAGNLSPAAKAADGQAAIDRAFGERLRRERRKWEREREAETDTARLTAKRHPGMETGGIPRRAASPAQEVNSEGAAPAGAGEDNRSLAARIARESAALAEQFPDFDALEFIRCDPVGVARMRAGYSLRDAYVLSHLGRLLDQSRGEGEALAARRIRSRNIRVPEATRGGAGALGKLDVAALSDEEFARIENMVSSGHKVRLT